MLKPLLLLRKGIVLSALYSLSFLLITPTAQATPTLSTSSYNIPDPPDKKQKKKQLKLREGSWKRIKKAEDRSKQQKATFQKNLKQSKAKQKKMQQRIKQGYTNQQKILKKRQLKSEKTGRLFRDNAKKKAKLF